MITRTLPAAQIAPASRMSPEDEREAFEMPIPGRCFPLAGHCGKPTGSPDVFWCDDHAYGGAK